MREVKYRGMSKNGWVYGLLHFNYGQGDYMITHSNGWQPSYNNPDEGESTEFTSIDPKTIGQYTGLKDKNGVEIYGGDVCKNYIWWDEPRIIGFNCLGTVCSIDEEGSEWSFSIDTAADIEVIGTIHTTPELLK